MAIHRNSGEPNLRDIIRNHCDFKKDIKHHRIDEQPHHQHFQLLFTLVRETSLRFILFYLLSLSSDFSFPRFAWGFHYNVHRSMSPLGHFNSLFSTYNNNVNSLVMFMYYVMFIGWDEPLSQGGEWIGVVTHRGTKFVKPKVP